MTKLLDDVYLSWLLGRVKRSVKSQGYWNLLRQMYSTEFIWFIPNDDNRVEDGLQLRYFFVHEENIDADENWVQLGCSFLEMLVALSERLSFEIEREPSECFWILVDNLGLTHYTDSYCRSHECYEEIDNILANVIWRTYKKDGTGGIFPQKGRGIRDQTQIEIWYQMQRYILDNY